MIDRRTLLAGSAALGLAATKTFAVPKPAGILGPEGQFSFEMLIGWAKSLSQRPFQKAADRDSALLEGLDYDSYQQIRFRPGLAIWPHDGGAYPVEPFHIGRYFKQPVQSF